MGFVIYVKNFSMLAIMRLHFGFKCLLKLQFCHRLQMHLIRAICNAQTTRPRIEMGQRCILAHALPAMHLDRSVNYVASHARNNDLCHSNLQKQLRKQTFIAACLPTSYVLCPTEN